jgi:nucleotide-binding universal stress UspA family protein
MIKDVMVHLDGTAGDEVRLAAGNDIADVFHSHIVGLFLNVLPVLIVPENGIGSMQSAELLNQARTAGDKVEEKLSQRLTRLQKPVELRRFDILNDTAGDVAAREARTADAFVALRPNGASRGAEELVEGVLFGSGRHVWLLPTRKSAKAAFDRILVAWNGSRESARALAEALPYLRKAKEAVVVVIDETSATEGQAIVGKDAINHLRHHGITAVLHRAIVRDNDIAATLIAEARRLKSDLIVMGGYGHSRLREWLLGGATYKLLHKSPVPLLIAH